MTAKKPDADNIRRFLQELAQQEWIKNSERRFWPRFVFHYTDLPNALSVLMDGYLYSRTYAEQSGKLVTSSGSNHVLESTEAEIKKYVRFYFRPKTPTQYWAEGIRSQASLSVSRFPDAHCPVPIFFLFDAATILTRADCRFSDGNLANRRSRLFSSAVELSALPWEKVYHNTSFDRNRADETDISIRRCAEIIVPKQIELDSLQYIICRSEAEKETLLYLLPGILRDRYASRITATNRIDLFDRKHTYVNRARLSADSMQFHFSPDTRSPGPFNVQVEILHNGIVRTHYDNLNLTESDPTYRITLRRPLESYDIMLRLDQHIAYAGSFFDFSTIPF